jgi:hypothetical protein
MEHDWQVELKQSEISIRCKNSGLVAYRYGADVKVDI